MPAIPTGSTKSNPKKRDYLVSLTFPLSGMELSRALRALERIWLPFFPKPNPTTAPRDGTLSRTSCAREDLNLHGLPRYHLKVVRLPVSPRALKPKP